MRSERMREDWERERRGTRKKVGRIDGGQRRKG